MRIKSAALFAGLALIGCRSSDNNNGIDGNNGGSDTGSNGGGTKIQDVQSDAMAVNTPVTLNGKVVTAVDTFGSTIGNIWIEEPEGGVNSGVLVFNKLNAVDVSTLVPGDIVNVTGGVKEEFAISSDTSGRTDTEVGPPSGGTLSIIKTGHTVAPAPMVVDALAIGQMATQAERDAAWEQYEGVLITVNNIEQFGALKKFGAGAPDQFSAHATGTLVIEESLVMFPDTAVASTCFSSMTGVVDYAFDYLLLPRATDDFGAVGAGCAPPEASSGATIGQCGDGIDNDGNGFGDCLDLGCETGPGAWLDPSNCTAASAMCGCSKNLASGTSVTIVNTTAGAASIGPVLLNNVFVTAVSGSGFWVADSLTAAPNGGVFVFQSATPTVTVGQKLATVQGLAGPFNPSKVAAATAKILVEVSNGTSGTATAGGTVVPLASTATAAGDLTAGATLAGSLVKLTNVKVKAVGSFNQVTLVDNANATITLDDSAFFAYGGTMASPMTPAVGTCFSTLTGAMSLTTTDTAGLLEVRTINPRSNADMVVAGAPTACTGS